MKADGGCFLALKSPKGSGRLGRRRELLLVVLLWMRVRMAGSLARI
jgi:hypothetical protein